MPPASQTPAQDNDSNFPIAFENCRMSPAGVASVVEHLASQPLLQSVPTPRLCAMAIAYLAYGGSEDNNNGVLNTGIHPAHHEAHVVGTHTWRGQLREDYRRTVMDILTWLDRLSGGGTLMVHASGTRPPSAPATVEEQKLDVFLPIHAVRTNTGVRVATARIIQHFAEHIGFPIMQNWDRAKGLQVGGPRHRATALRAPTNRSVGQPLMPPLTSPAVTFYGRPPGTIEPLIAQEVGTGIGDTLPPTQSAAAATAGGSNTAATAGGSNAALPAALVTSNVTLPAPPSASLSPRRGASAYARIKSEDRDDSQQLPMSHSSGGHAVAPRYSQAEQDAVRQLEARIIELENIIQTQGEEISTLRTMLEGNMHYDRSRSLLTGSGSDRASASSAGTFGHRKGKAPVHREHTPSSPTLHSASSVSSVSSISPTPSPSPSPRTPAGTPSASRAISRASYVSHTSHASATESSQTRRRRGSDGEGGYNYGYFTDHAVAFHGLPEKTFELLCSMQLRYASAAWDEGVLHTIPDIGRAIAGDIAEAMRKDWGLDERK